MQQYFNIMYVSAIAVLLVAMAFGLVRTIIGPRRADRILGVNMIGSLATLILAILGVYLKQNWILDVCLVYCLMSYIAVVILAKVQISEQLKRTGSDKDKEVDRYE